VRTESSFLNPDLRLGNNNLNFLHYACRLLCEIYIFRFDLQYSQYIFHSCISQVTLSFLHRLNQLFLFYRFTLFKNCSSLHIMIITEQWTACMRRTVAVLSFSNQLLSLFSLCLVLSFWIAGRWRTVNVLLFSVTVWDSSIIRGLMILNSLPVKNSHCSPQ